MPNSTVCQAASGDKVREAFSRLGPITNFGDSLYDDTRMDYAQKLAANQLSHLVEGWRYLSSSFFAYLSNSHNDSFHMAYYAELRSAFSLFAFSGINVNSHQRYYLDSAGNRHSLQLHGGSGSHEKIWSLWKNWGGRQDAHDLIMQGITLPNKEVKLAHFYNHLGRGMAIRNIEGWAYDLCDPDIDRDERNSRSYQPYWSTNPLTKMTPSDFELIRKSWKFILSDSGSQLGFDSAYIKYLVEKYEASHFSGPSQEGDRERWFQQMIQDVSRNTGVDQQQITFFLRDPDVDTSMFDLAESQSREAANAIARAILMLRLATLALQSHVSQTSSKTEIVSWLWNWAIHAGFASSASQYLATDLTADFEPVVFDMDAIEPLPHTFFASPVSSDVLRLSRPDACLIWSLLS